jgi:hypothetical protein
MKFAYTATVAALYNLSKSGRMRLVSYIGNYWEVPLFTSLVVTCP